MSVWGDQWKCACGWSNFFMRKRCRNCGAPSTEAVGHETAKNLMERMLPTERREPDREPPQIPD